MTLYCTSFLLLFFFAFTVRSIISFICMTFCVLKTSPKCIYTHYYYELISNSIIAVALFGSILLFLCVFKSWNCVRIAGCTRAMVITQWHHLTTKPTYILYSLDKKKHYAHVCTRQFIFGSSKTNCKTAFYIFVVSNIRQQDEAFKQASHINT